MARKKTTVTGSEIRAKKSIAKAKVDEEVIPNARVEHVDSRVFVTVDPGSKLWGKDADQIADSLPEGAAVRLQPPCNATPGFLETLVHLVRLRKCVVVVEPKEKDVEVVSNETKRRVDDEEDPRKVLAGLIEKSNSRRKDDLRARCERTLASVKLDSGAFGQGGSVYLKRVKIRNFLCYRGDHEIELEPKVYALVAQHVDDSERSNAQGKSALLKALGPFPLFGWSGKKTEDAWITDGEPDGYVIQEYSDGTVVERSRKRGASTQRKITIGGKPAGQKGFEEAVLDWLGLVEEEFFTCFLKQKDIDRLLVEDPSVRQAIFFKWLGLEPLQQASKIAEQELAQAIETAGFLEREVERIRQGLGMLRHPDVITKEIDRLRVDLVGYDAELKEVGARIQASGKLRTAYQAKVDRERVKAEGERLKEEHDKIVVPEDKDVHENVAAKMAEVAKLKEESDRLSMLVRGKFDGACPVSSGLKCPVAKKINDDREKHRVQHATTQDTYEKAQLALQAASREASAITRARSQKTTLEANLGALRVRWKELDKLAAEAPDVLPPSEDARFHELGRNIAYTEATVRALENERANYSTAEERLQPALERFAAAVEERTLAAEHAAIMGRTGLQRACARAKLAKLEEGANEVLKVSGSDMVLAISWDRPGQGLALNCAACGQPFPKSAKIKRCEGCGAERGPNIIEKLEFVLNKESGGLEDMAGFGLQTAASARIRARRRSPWAISYVDELFAHFDKASRKSVSSHLAAMLKSRHGFEQAFVVAHTEDAVSTMPGQIQVTGAPKGSTVKVLA